MNAVSSPLNVGPGGPVSESCGLLKVGGCHESDLILPLEDTTESHWSMNIHICITITERMPYTTDTFNFFPLFITTIFTSFQTSFNILLKIPTMFIDFTLCQNVNINGLMISNLPPYNYFMHTSHVAYTWQQRSPWLKKAQEMPLWLCNSRGVLPPFCRAFALAILKWPGKHFFIFSQDHLKDRDRDISSLKQRLSNNDRCFSIKEILSAFAVLICLNYTYDNQKINSMHMLTKVQKYCLTKTPSFEAMTRSRQWANSFFTIL